MGMLAFAGLGSSLVRVVPAGRGSVVCLVVAGWPWPRALCCCLSSTPSFTRRLRPGWPLRWRTWLWSPFRWVCRWRWAFPNRRGRSATGRLGLGLQRRRQRAGHESVHDSDGLLRHPGRILDGRSLLCPGVVTLRQNRLAKRHATQGRSRAISEHESVSRPVARKVGSNSGGRTADSEVANKRDGSKKGRALCLSPFLLRRIDFAILVTPGSGTLPSFP